MAVLSVPSKEEENGLRLQLLRGKIEERLLVRYHQYYPRDPKDLYQAIQNDERRIRALMSIRVLNRLQYDLLLPASAETNSGRFDTTLLAVLLREFCGIPEPVTGWMNDPYVNDRSEGANLVRFRTGRNKIQHEKCQVSDQRFQEIFMYVKPALLDCGCTTDEINGLLNCSLDRNVVKKLDLERKRADHLESCLSSVTYGLFPTVHNFFGRNKELEELHHQLVNLESRKLGLVVSGLGGIGKSELCRKYCEEYGSTSFCNNVLWLNGESETSLQQSFQTVAQLINLMVTDNNGRPLSTQTVVNKVYRYFGKRKLLVVLDGVESYSILVKYLPCPQTASTVSVLITSQNKNCTARFAEIPLKVFTPKSANEFMRKNLKEQKCNLNATNSQNLAELLEYHPLALQQAVSYIQENNMSVDQFNVLLRQQAPIILKEVSAVDIGQKSVMTTLSLALGKLKNSTEERGSAIDLLHFMCFLNVRSINRRLLYEAFNDDVVKTNEALKTLKTYSLINVMNDITMETLNEQVISIHSLVQMAIQHEEKKDSQSMQRYEEALEIIFKERSDNDQAEPLYKHKHLCDHIVHIYNQPQLRELLLLKSVEQIHFLFEIFKARAMYKELQLILESVQAMLKKQCENMEESSKKQKQQDTEYYIALLLSYRKHYDEALEMFRRMESSLQRNSKELTEILYIQSNIASCLIDKTDYDGALKIFQQVEEFELNLYPTGHPSLLTTQSNIALCLLNNKRSDDALSILCNVVNQKLKLYSREDPQVLLTQSNLAYCLYARKEYEEALDILRQVEDCQKSYDKEHPNLQNTQKGIDLCVRKIRKRKAFTVKCSCIVN